MKNVFEKIVERLKELSQWHQEYGDTIGYAYRAFDSAIEIVNQVAEQFGNSEQVDDFCKWTLCDEEANVYDTTCRNPHTHCRSEVRLHTTLHRPA